MEGGFWLFVGSFGLLAFAGLVFVVFWIWSIIDVIRSDFKDTITKAIWIGLLIFLPVLGVLIYIFVGKSTKIKMLE